jgi:quercetin dioxygenase-like cupin family protein
MKRAFLLVLMGVVLGAGGVSFAWFHEEGPTVRVISSQDIREKLDGKDSKVTFVEVTLEGGQVEMSHRHPGPGFVYVLEGQYELGIDDRPTKIYKAGETFYEATGALHRVGKNPDPKKRARLMAVVVHPRDAKEIAIPEDSKKKH